MIQLICDSINLLNDANCGGKTPFGMQMWDCGGLFLRFDVLLCFWCFVYDKSVNRQSTLHNFLFLSITELSFETKTEVFFLFHHQWYADLKCLILLCGIRLCPVVLRKYDPTKSQAWELDNAIKTECIRLIHQSARWRLISDTQTLITVHFLYFMLPSF